mmetsp:Transcript_15348/g.27371  ORF Transcript_15348/g.27371 Transcript_15348/m.27371 type:complete len:228 (-) Transcript_15348:9-692(-)
MCVSQLAFPLFLSLLLSSFQFACPSTRAMTTVTLTVRNAAGTVLVGPKAVSSDTSVLDVLQEFSAKSCITRLVHGERRLKGDERLGELQQDDVDLTAIFSESITATFRFGNPTYSVRINVEPLDGRDLDSEIERGAEGAYGFGSAMPQALETKSGKQFFEELLKHKQSKPALDEQKDKAELLEALCCQAEQATFRRWRKGNGQFGSLGMVGVVDDHLVSFRYDYDFS